MMSKSPSFKLIYLDLARQDVKESKAWYKKQLPGLEKRFANAIRNAVLRLQANPYAFAIRYSKFRIIHPAIFPFAIHFYIKESEKQIIITAVMHDYRDIQITEA